MNVLKHATGFGPGMVSAFDALLRELEEAGADPVRATGSELAMRSLVNEVLANPTARHRLRNNLYVTSEDPKEEVDGTEMLADEANHGYTIIVTNPQGAVIGQLEFSTDGAALNAYLASQSYLDDIETLCDAGHPVDEAIDLAIEQFEVGLRLKG